METGTRHTTTDPQRPVEALATDRSQWPTEATAAYRDVLRELDRWSREHGSTLDGNDWIAEEAVRQSW
jgi:hypothetical protein